LAVTQSYLGVGAAAGTSVISGSRAWYWLAADGRGQAQLQAVAAPEGSASQQGLRDRLFGDHALPANLRSLLVGAQPAGELHGCAASSQFVSPAELEGKVIAGDASVAHDPLSGHGMYEALAGTAAVVAGINTWLERGEWPNVRRFLKERSAHLWSRKLRVASAFYAEVAATAQHPFWSQTARSYRELERSLPSAAPNVAEFQHRPVLDGSRIELRKVLVTPRWPRGIWRYREIEQAARRVGRVLCGATVFLLASSGAFAQDDSTRAQTLLRTYCSGCHAEQRPGDFRRISAMRKSPEGWLMTLFRMQQVHHLALPEDARATILKYLSDTEGLAPAESAKGRFALERRPNEPDVAVTDELAAMCGRCHSLARVTLQRRDPDEWLKLIHTHVGQFPTLEYQALARDRFWWETATTELPGKLAQLFPLDTPAWRAWQAGRHASPAGDWIVFGRIPGGGGYYGTLKVSAVGGNEFTATYALRHADGKPMESMNSRVIVYTGYEWRGTSEQGASRRHEVFALSEDGRSLSGRWFDAEHAETGGELTAQRSEGPAAILAVFPPALKTGTTQEVVIVGRKLAGRVSFGPGTSSSVISRDANAVRVNVAVAPTAAVGMRTLQVGTVETPRMAVIYDRIERLEVRPGLGIARLGGGRVPGVAAQFEAFGYMMTRMGSARSEAVPLGPIQVDWRVEPHGERAAKDNDVQFAGVMRPDGRFEPASAGPNPQRAFSTNNAGDLNVVGELKQAGSGSPVRAQAHLIVTMQRWITPPIY
jgi:quinohemoprotein amine dehydrogenase